jgi:hypothetical protein
MKKIPLWLGVTGAVVGLWYLSKPKATGATIGATGAATATAGSIDAGRTPHGGGGHHVHHGGGHRGFVGHSVDLIDYGLAIECDPRFPCAQQPILPCRCG